MRAIFTISISAALLGLAGCATSQGVASPEATLTSAALPASKVAAGSPDPAVLLRPYYKHIAADLPKASPGKSLDASEPLTRFAFGSCNHQSRSQHMWARIAARNPQLFLLIGDNVYGDNGWQGDAALTSLRDSYALQASHPEFIAFRAKIPMATTWDDHDFGFNDGGGNFAFRERAEEIYENFWGSSDVVKSRPGVYQSMMIGPAGKRVQIVLLDTRFFRSPIKTIGYTEQRPPLGASLPDDDPAKTMLGAAQWQWLQAELERPADLRLVVSSIQVLTDAHGFEKWGNFPLERDRLLMALKARKGGDILLLSGDRHSAAMYRDTPDMLGESVWEFTSSSLNLAFVSADADEREPDPLRRSSMFTQENFGMVDIDWVSKKISLILMDADGKPITTQGLELGK